MNPLYVSSSLSCHGFCYFQTPIKRQKDYFYPVKGNDSKYLPSIKNLFENSVESLYKDQASTLEKIARGEDRNSELLIRGKYPEGLVIYKTEPSDEYSNYGVKESLEIKTLVVCDPNANSSSYLKTALLKRVDQYANNKKILNQHVIVSEKAPADQDFFQKKGFECVAEWQNQHLLGCKEKLFSKKNVTIL